MKDKVVPLFVTCNKWNLEKQKQKLSLNTNNEVNKLLYYTFNICISNKTSLNV
jgi:uncharacterized phage-associated protein